MQLLGAGQSDANASVRAPVHPYWARARQLRRADCPAPTLWLVGEGKEKHPYTLRCLLQCLPLC